MSILYVSLFVRKKENKLPYCTVAPFCYRCLHVWKCCSAWVPTVFSQRHKTLCFWSFVQCCSMDFIWPQFKMFLWWNVTKSVYLRSTVCCVHNRDLNLQNFYWITARFPVFLVNCQLNFFSLVSVGQIRQRRTKRSWWRSRNARSTRIRGRRRSARTQICARRRSAVARRRRSGRPRQRRMRHVSGILRETVWRPLNGVSHEIFRAFFGMYGQI